MSPTRRILLRHVIAIVLLTAVVTLGIVLAVRIVYVDAQPYGFQPPPGVSIQDEAVAQGRARTLNCAGAGITCAVAAGVATFTVPGGGGGSANVVAVEVDFTASGNTNASTVVIGQAWVTATSVILCGPTLFATADRTDGMEDALIEGLTTAVSARVVGTGFTVHAAPTFGRAIGRYSISCTGV